MKFNILSEFQTCLHFKQWYGHDFYAGGGNLYAPTLFTT